MHFRRPPNVSAMLSSPERGTGAADVEATRCDEHHHRPPAETQPTEQAREAGTREDDRHCQAPRRRHYGEIIDDVADPPDYEAATERAQQIIQRRLRSPD